MLTAVILAIFFIFDRLVVKNCLHEKGQTGNYTIKFLVNLKFGSH